MKEVSEFSSAETDGIAINNDSPLFDDYSYPIRNPCEIDHNEDPYLCAFVASTPRAPLKPP